jgi:hypothetical protein
MRRRGRQDASPIQAFQKRIGSQKKVDKPSKFRFHPAEGAGDVGGRLAAQVSSYAPKLAHTSEETIAREPLVESLQLFLEAGPLTHPDGETGTRAQVPEVAYVVVQAFELQKEHPQRPCARRRRCSRERLDRLAIRHAVGKGACAAHPLRNLDSTGNAFSLGELLDSSVRVEQPGLELQHKLAHSGKSEVSRLNDAGVDRPYRDFDDAFAVELMETVLRAANTRNHASGIEVFAQGIGASRPIVMEDESSWIRVEIRD